jgi:hypothetical protein
LEDTRGLFRVKVLTLEIYGMSEVINSSTQLRSDCRYCLRPSHVPERPRVQIEKILSGLRNFVVAGGFFEGLACITGHDLFLELFKKMKLPFWE